MSYMATLKESPPRQFLHLVELSSADLHPLSAPAWFTGALVGMTISYLRHGSKRGSIQT